MSEEACCRYCAGSAPVTTDVIFGNVIKWMQAHKSHGDLSVNTDARGVHAFCSCGAGKGWKLAKAIDPPQPTPPLDKNQDEEEEKS